MSETTGQMTPDASPGGVRRVNNIPMYLLGGVLVLFLLVMALVAIDRASKQNEPASGPRKKADNASMFAREIAGEQTSGMIEPTKPIVAPKMPTNPNTAAVMIAKSESLDAPLPPPPLSAASGSRLNIPAQDDEAMRIRMTKFQQLEEAAKAKTGVQIGALRSSARSGDSTPSGRTTTGAPQSRGEVLARLSEVRQQIDAQRDSNPTAAYQDRLAQIRDMGIGGGEAAPKMLQTSTNTGGDNVEQFAGNGDDRWKLDTKPSAPRSPFELRAGFVVPATLIFGINSDLPGQIVAQVAQNVYDTPTGKHLLIPLGARLVGSYASDVKYGQARVLVAWQRIVFPDGKAMDIGAMPGADSAGYAGFTDQVNNHYLRLFGSAFLMSGVTAGIAYSQRHNQMQGMYGVPSASSVMSEALGQQLGQATAQLVAKNLSIAPTLEIRPGYRFSVVVTKDMTFSKPYRSFDY